MVFIFWSTICIVRFWTGFHNLYCVAVATCTIMVLSVWIFAVSSTDQCLMTLIAASTASKPVTLGCTILAVPWCITIAAPILACGYATDATSALTLPFDSKASTAFTGIRIRYKLIETCTLRFLTQSDCIPAGLAVPISAFVTVSSIVYWSRLTVGSD